MKRVETADGNLEFGPIGTPQAQRVADADMPHCATAVREPKIWG